MSPYRNTGYLVEIKKHAEIQWLALAAEKCTEFFPDEMKMSKVFSRDFIFTCMQHIYM